MELTAEQKKTLVIVVVLGLVGVGGLGYYWWMIGQKTVADAKKATETAVADEAEFTKKRNAIVVYRKEVEADYDALKVRIVEAEKQLPSTRQAIVFNRVLDGILKETEVRRTKLARGTIASEARYEEIPYSITATSGFHDFGKFLNMVEQNDQRLMRVKGFKMDLDKTFAAPSRHGIETDIATFRFVTEAMK